MAKDNYTEDFVLYEQAKSMFSLGFMTGDIYRYYITKEIRFSEGYDIMTGVMKPGQLVYGPVYEEDGDTDRICYDRCVPAATVYQAIRWLAEQKKIVIWIEPDFRESDDGSLIYISHYCDMRDEIPLYGRTISCFNSDMDTNIRDAYLSGIDMALNLLEKN